MAAAYLNFNAVLYAVFAAWCTLAPHRTAAALGLATTNAGGRSEYLVVYGGLQLGLALFFLYCARLPEPRTGLVFALALYVPLVAYRLVTLARFWPVGPTTLAVAALEAALLAIAAILWLAREGGPDAR